MRRRRDFLWAAAGLACAGPRLVGGEAAPSSPAAPTLADIMARSPGRGS